jgi:hypothetical protein
MFGCMGMMYFVIFLLVFFYLERTVFINVSHPFTIKALVGGEVTLPPFSFPVLSKFLSRVSLLMKLSLSLSISFLGMRN